MRSSKAARRAVTSLPIARTPTFPGTPIPNTILGFWFYGFVVVLGLGIAAAKGQWLAPLKQVRLILVVGGAIYALYLMYRLFFSLESLCGLCLTSHALTFVLTGLVLADTRRTLLQPLNPPLSMRNKPFYLGLLFLALVLVGFDVVLFGEDGDSVASPSRGAD